MSDEDALARLHVDLHTATVDHGHAELHARVAALEESVARWTAVEAEVAVLREAAEAAREAAIRAEEAARAAEEHVEDPVEQPPAEHRPEVIEPETVVEVPPETTHRLLR